jgi:hypothetical protein
MNEGVRLLKLDMAGCQATPITQVTIQYLKRKIINEESKTAILKTGPP